jgi:cytochrome c oxidase cbb3-type subunit 3
MKTKIFLPILLVALGFVQSVYGQGEALFKAKCNTCHAVDKNSTGPLLKGVKQKWTDAGEAELLYKWVQNSKSLIAGGQSKMANAIQNFSASEMPPQQATAEEVDQILGYIDNYVKPAATAAVSDSTSVAGEPLNVKPNYEDNLTMFYWLLGLMVVLLLAIILLTSSIMTFIKSDVFKKKLKEKEEKEGSNIGKIVTLLVIGLALFLPANTFALDFVHHGETEEKSLWLLVERSDLYFMIVIDFLLLMVVVYLKGLFNSFFYMAFPKTVKAKKARAKKISKVLTDVVPIEEEGSILMDHEYDGIQELDNNLPPWWVWGFYITIFFSFIYILNYHIFQTSDLQIKAYDKEMAQAQKDIDAYLKSQAMNVDETNVTKLTDAAALGEGKTIFTTNCTTCHKDGQGDIGPNLTDKFWIYGNDIKTVFGTIKNGTANGMPDHASKLNPVELQKVASYVLSMKYKEGKAPQGTEYK